MPLLGILSLLVEPRPSDPAPEAGFYPTNTGLSRPRRWYPPGMPFGIGLPEILILLLVALLVFGPKRLPEMGRSLGRGMREFKDSVSGKDDDEPVHRQQARELEPADAPRVDETSAAPRERDSVT